MHGIGRAGHAVLPLGADGGHHHPAAGTPLYDFIGTQYDDVLTKYLGDFAALRLTNDTNYNNVLLSSLTCTVHNAGSTAAARPP